MNYSLSYNDISLSQMDIKGEMIRDLWRQQDLGVFDDILKVKIPARGLLLYKISKVENKKCSLDCRLILNQKPIIEI